MFLSNTPFFEILPLSYVLSYHGPEIADFDKADLWRAFLFVMTCELQHIHHHLNQPGLVVNRKSSLKEVVKRKPKIISQEKQTRRVTSGQCHGPEVQSTQTTIQEYPHIHLDYRHLSICIQLKSSSISIMKLQTRQTTRSSGKSTLADIRAY